MENTISLPPQARTYFDGQAESLIAALRPLVPQGQPPPPRGSEAHVPRMAHFTEDDIAGPIEVMYFGWSGRLRGFEVHGGNINEFLPQEAAETLQRIANTVAVRRELNTYCGMSYVSKHLMDWVRRRRLGEPVDTSWTTDFLESLACDVKDWTILIPLEGIQISDPFELGQVAFDYFTQSALDEITRSIPPDAPSVAESCEHLRMHYQGRVYARYQCRAEGTYAQELAEYQTDKALEVLQLFSAAAFHLRARCPLGRMGQVARAEWHAFRIRPDGGPMLSRGVERTGAVDLRVDEELLHFFEDSGIGIAHELLRKPELSDLEERGLEAISHFAHGVVSSAPQDRLLHALVAVESLLLRDTTEPIQSRVGYRIALLAAKTLDDRKRAMRDFVDGYSLRSKFVHHGAKSDDVEAASRLLVLCLATVDAVMKMTKRFKSKQALLDYLEDELLAPSSVELS